MLVHLIAARKFHDIDFARLGQGRPAAGSYQITAMCGYHRRAEDVPVSGEHRERARGTGKRLRRNRFCPKLTQLQHAA